MGRWVRVQFLMGMCLFGGGQGPSGDLSVGLGWAALLCSLVLGQGCVLATSYFVLGRCCLVLTPFSFACDELGSLHPLSVLVQESRPRSPLWGIEGAGEE